MVNNTYRPFAKTLIALVLLVATQPLRGQEVESLSRRIVNWNEAEQKAWIDTYVADGMPPGDELGMLVLNRGATTLPLLESKIEGIIGSSSPKRLFTNPLAEPVEVVRLAAALIASAGTEQSLREASKLIKLDEQRFGNLVKRTLVAATARGNSFTVAYRGIGLNDPLIEPRVIAWVEGNFGSKQQSTSRFFKRLWAEALIENYGGIPSVSQMANDPIAIRLKPTSYAALESEIKLLTVEAASKRHRQD